MEYLGDESMTVKDFLYGLGTFDHPSKFRHKITKLTLYTLVLEQLV